MFTIVQGLERSPSDFLRNDDDDEGDEDDEDDEGDDEGPACEGWAHQQGEEGGRGQGDAGARERGGEMSSSQEEEDFLWGSSRRRGRR